MGDEDKFDQAKTYSETNKEQTSDGLKLIELLSPFHSSSVLDLGCGTGNVTKILAERNRQGTVLGIDIDPDRLEIAKRSYLADNLKYELAGVDNMPGGNYDLVFSNHMLHWVKDHEAVFGLVASKLKSGGKFAFNMLSAIDQEMIEEVLGWASDDLIQQVMAPLKGLSTSDVERLAKENGFEVEHLQTGLYVREYADAETYIEVAFLVHGYGTRDMYDADKIQNYYGPGKIKEKIKTTTAVLCKISGL